MTWLAPQSRNNSGCIPCLYCHNITNTYLVNGGFFMFVAHFPVSGKLTPDFVSSVVSLLETREARVDILQNKELEPHIESCRGRKRRKLPLNNNLIHVHSIQPALEMIRVYFWWEMSGLLCSSLASKIFNQYQQHIGFHSDYIVKIAVWLLLNRRYMYSHCIKL